MKRLRRNEIFRYIINELIKKRLMRFLSDKYFILIEYFATKRQLPNLKNPQTFTDKIQWIKIYGGLEKYNDFVDKYKVREYVKKTIGEEYLIPLYGVWDKPDDINFDKLPEKFVLKATHGSHYIYICHDKSKLNKVAVLKKADYWIKDDYYLKSREAQYKYNFRKIMCEGLLEDEFGGDLKDYKIFCYNGIPKIVEIVFWWNKEREGDIADVYKDTAWQTLDVSYIGFPYSKKPIQKPENLAQLLDVAAKLAKPFPFVRVDLYSVFGKIYFGELTFTPGSGLERFTPREADLLLGKDIDLTKYSKEIAV